MAFFPYENGSIEQLCDELDDWRERLDRSGSLSRRWRGQLRRELQAEAVAASVGMEQVPVTVDEVRRILVGEKPSTVSEENQELVRGYREAMEFVLRRADDPGFRWNRELVVGLHDRVLAGNYAAGAGRFATGPRWVINSLTGEEVFEPPDWRNVPQLVDEACERLEEGFEHPAVEAAWIHVVTAAIHPFSDGNGRVCRVLASLAMYRGGFKRQEFTSLEEWWGRHLADYYAAFACLGRSFEPEADVTSFVDAHIRAQLSQVRALDLRQKVERRVWEALELVIEEIGLRARLVHALWDAFFERSITPAYYIPLAEVSRATATNDLSAAVAAGVLEAKGAGRGRHYVATPRLYDLVGQALGIELPSQNQRARIIAALTRDQSAAGQAR
jgi:Fic family protein